MAKIIEHEVNAHFARDFAGLRSAHAITNNVNTQPLIPSQTVLIVPADRSDVGLAGCFSNKAHGRARALLASSPSAIGESATLRPKTVPLVVSHWEVILRDTNATERHTNTRTDHKDCWRTDY